MSMHSIYFLAYASILTVTVMVMGWAYYSRFKAYGTPVNFGILALVSVFALAMWTGVAISEFMYNRNATNTMFSMFFMVSWVSAGAYWQANGFINGGRQKIAN